MRIDFFAAKRAFAALIAASLACGLLVACDDTPDPEAAQEQQGEEAPVAEVLDGSVSDSMIALDELRSQAPLGAGEASGDSEDGEEGGDAAGNAAE